MGFGAASGKVRMETKLAGRGASARVTGAYAGNGRQHLDYDTTQEHAAEDTNSDLSFRGVLSGRATAVWRGMINVDKGAQRTDAFQDCRNLLLSSKAHADAIPGLQIEADDVRCTHAAAVAQVDPDQLFYLTSRGLDRDTASSLIVEGFLAELVERVPEGALADAFSGALETRLAELLRG
jgi:Fe-S cluster assembly protein SufD